MEQKVLEAKVLALKMAGSQRGPRRLISWKQDLQETMRAGEEPRRSC